MTERTQPAKTARRVKSVHYDGIKLISLSPCPQDLVLCQFVPKVKFFLLGHYCHRQPACLSE